MLPGLGPNLGPNDILMKTQLFLFIFLLSGSSLLAQWTEDHAAVRQTIEQLFDGMRNGDSIQIASAFVPNAQMATAFYDKEGTPQYRLGSLERFLGSVAVPHEGLYDEKLWSMDFQIDGPIAQAWTEYSFFVDTTLSHCGVNTFHLAKTTDGWKIPSVLDSRRKEGCQSSNQDIPVQLDQIMNDWHHAAATADADAFFGTMTKDGIYLGTDPSERWLRDELRSWAGKAFEREVAWAFTPSDRVWYFNPSQDVAWFEELLDTWMGTCRGSGVLVKTSDGWKLKHYNLAVTIANEKIKGFIELTKEAPETKE